RARIRREDHDALAKVGGPALTIREASVVEKLEEKAPDVAVGLLELVEENDREGLRANRRDQCRRLALRIRIAQQALEARLRLELAHVEPNEAVRRAEEELRQRLRDLGLARSRRADEEEDAERTRRIGQI